jgi:hypothetical protein
LTSICINNKLLGLQCETWKQLNYHKLVKFVVHLAEVSMISFCKGSFNLYRQLSCLLDFVRFNGTKSHPHCWNKYMVLYISEMIIWFLHMVLQMQCYLCCYFIFLVGLSIPTHIRSFFHMQCSYLHMQYFVKNISSVIKHMCHPFQTDMSYMCHACEI